MAAISAPRASCFPARQNLSSICRPGSIPIPTRSRSFRLACSPRLPQPAALADLVATAARSYGAPSAGACGGRAGLADPGWRKRHSSWRAAAPRCWRRPMPSMAAWRSLRATMSWKLPRSRSSPTRASPSSSIPNNPDGRLVAKDALLALADRLRRRGGLLLVDEAFMEVGPEGASLGDHVEEGNIVVLRSFGKFYGLPGLRLSFALAAPEIAARIGTALGPWPVSSAALAIGAAALADADWQEADARQAGRGGAEARCVSRQSGARGDRRHLAVPPGAEQGRGPRVSVRWARPASWCGASPSIRHGCASVFPAAKRNGKGSRRALASVGESERARRL